MMTQLAGRLVLQCDVEGRVLSSVGPGKSLVGQTDEPRPLALCVDPGSAAKCERFLARVRAGGAFGWELQLSAGHGVHELLFAGLPARGQRLCIVAAESAQSLLALLDEQVAAAAVGASVEGAAAPPDSGGMLPERLAAPPKGFSLDELTRVNSELLCLQRELAKRNAELAAITIQRNELLACAAHDLRNPLLVMQGYCDLLEVGNRLALGTQRELVGRVQHASQLMLHILEDTLEYARLENRVQPHPAVVDLAKLTQEIVWTHRPIALRKQITLVLNIGGRLPRLRLDPTHMQQIIGNLLSNAIKYSDPGSQIDVGLAQHGDQVRLEVCDRGQGIAESELPLLFRPFQTTSARPTAGELSTGLGLAIVRKLVEASGGAISVRSAVHEGSTFTVCLPIQRASGSQPSRTSPARSRSTGPNQRVTPSSKRRQN